MPSKERLVGIVLWLHFAGLVVWGSTVGWQPIHHWWQMPHTWPWYVWIVGAFLAAELWPVAVKLRKTRNRK